MCVLFTEDSKAVSHLLNPRCFVLKFSEKREERAVSTSSHPVGAIAVTRV